jgi:hypothetical protein
MARYWRSKAGGAATILCSWLKASSWRHRKRNGWRIGVAIYNRLAWRNGESSIGSSAHAGLASWQYHQLSITLARCENINGWPSMAWRKYQ